jgi:hypothetical protein
MSEGAGIPREAGLGEPPAAERAAATPPASSASSASYAAGASSADVAADPQVAEVLQSLRSGVRQRQAEAATVGGLAGGSSVSPGGLAASFLAVRSHEYVQEPVPFSHRARYGKLIVFARKAFFHLFLKWFLRPALAQQNAFNQAAARLLQDLAEAEERTARETRLLAARLADLEAREAAGASSAAGVSGSSGAPAARRDPPP